MKRTTKRAIEKYGLQTCIDAYEMHLEGNGASTVSHSFSVLKGNTNMGDAAINAGRDLAESKLKLEYNKGMMRHEYQISTDHNIVKSFIADSDEQAEDIFFSDKNLPMNIQLNLNRFDVEAYEWVNVTNSIRISNN
jgi:hypothetical protein